MDPFVYAPEPKPDTTAGVPNQPAPPASTQMNEHTTIAPLPTEPATPTVPEPIVSMDPIPTPLPDPAMEAAPISMPGYVPPTTPIQAMSFNSQKKSHKKPLLLSLAGGIVVALIAGGVVFGYVLPNKPENVWSNGLTRSGKALSALVNNASQKDSLENFKKSDISASVTGTFQGETFNGTLGTKFDDSGANGSLVIKAKATGQTEQNYSLNFIGQVIKGQAFPTTYLQLNGFKSLGLDSQIPGISKFDGKWITISSDYYQKLGLGDLTSTKKDSLTAADIAELTNTATSITAKRVFTADPKVAVFERRSFVGKESVDGVSAYHYTVGINNANLVSYCKDLIDTEMGTAAYKKLPFYDSATAADGKKSAEKNCEDSGKNIKDTQTFDMWIGTKYKLVYKLRFTDDTNKNSYVDVGQKYNGGDDITLFVHGYDAAGKTDVLFNLKTNIKTTITSADLTVDGKSTDNPYNVKVTLNAKPFSGSINTKTPAGTIKLEDVLKQLGIDPAEFLGGAGSSSGSSADSKVKDDVSRLQAELDEYTSNHNGNYPTLVNFSNSSWRKTNMPNLTLSNSNFTIGATASSTQYAYAATGCGANGCHGYSISALLIDGTIYKKDNTN